MILSNESLFADGQAITVATRVVSTNVMQLVKRGQPVFSAAPFIGDIGKGTPVPFLIQVTEAFVGSGDLTVTIETGATASLGTSLLSVTIPEADLVAGQRTNLAWLPDGVTGEFLGVSFKAATAPTAGKITVGIVSSRQTNGSGM